MATTINVPAPTAEPSPQAPVSAPVEGGSPQTQDRRELYSRIYGESQQVAEPEPTTQVTEPSAQDGQPLESDTVESIVASPPDPTETRFSKVEETLSQIVNVLSQLTQPTPPVPQAPSAPKPAGEWLELLRQGKVEEAEAELARTLANKFVPQAKSEATSEALEMFRVETDLTTFVNDLKKENPDLLPLEDLIAAKAKVRLETLQASGKIKSANDYIAAYKDAVNTSADEARKIVQTIRAAGREDAAVRSREVLSSSTVPPSTIAQNRGVVTPKPSVKTETTEDYLARRRASAARGAGLATN